MPRIIYTVDCTDPFGDPCWDVTAFDVTNYRNQGYASMENEIKWKASEHEVTRNVPYKFQQDLKDIVIKTRGDFLDYFKKQSDKARYLDEKERLKNQVEQIEPEKTESIESGSENATNNQPNTSS
jgi:hypothetical protein